MRLLRNKELFFHLLLQLILLAAFTAAGFSCSAAAGFLLLGLGLCLILCQLVFTLWRYHRLTLLSRRLDEMLHHPEPEDFSDYNEGELAILKNELSKLTLRLSQQNLALAEDKRYLADSMADISHQLRSPLTSLSLIHTLLQEPNLTQERYQQLLRELAQQLDRMDWLIEAMLKISRMDAGTVQFYPLEISAQQLVEDAVATRRQLIRSVLFEAAFLCIIGIPLGIASGLSGIGITLHFTGHTIAGIFAGGNQAIFLTLHPSVGAIAIAVLLAFCTVLLSAFLPAKRAMKLSAIDAIRQTTDVSIRPGKVKTSRLTEKLFGFEGMLASKNYKRSRKRYRATVISLFLSVVLFIPASSFSAYLTASADRFYKDSEYDITVSLYNAADREAASQLLTTIPEVTRYGYSAMTTIRFTVGNEYLNDSYVKTEKLLHEEAATATDDSAHTYNGTLLFIPDDVFRDYLNDNSLDPADYFDTGAPRAILNDQLHKYSSDTKKYYDYSMLKNPTDADVQLAFYEYLSSENMYAQDPELVPVTIGAVLTDLPYGVHSNDYSIQLLYPYSMMDALLTSLDAEKDYDSLTGLPLTEYMAPDFMIRCSDHKAAYEKIKKQMEEQDISGYVYDRAESAEESRAMLKSVGLSPRGMRRMMQFECLLYGFRGLLYGLPVSIFVTWLIYRSVSAGLELSFFVPWYSVFIAVGSVFLVVAITMVYSMCRLNRENTVDALKNENL